MKHRVAALVGPVAEKMWVSTFHSACVRILRRDGQLLGYPSSFTIYDQADAVRLCGYVLRDLNLDAEALPAAVGAERHLARPRTTASAPRSTPSGPPTSSNARSPRCTSSTRPGCCKAGAMDFDDLLVNAVELLRPPSRGAGPLPAAVPATSWSTSTRTPTGSRTTWSCCWPRRATATCVVGDCRPVDLQVPRGRHPQHRRVRGRLPRGHRRAARAELPVDPDHPRRRQRRHRQQHGPQAQGAVDREPARARRIVRYHADDEGDEAQWVAHQLIAPPRRGPSAVGRLCRLLPHQRPEPGGRGVPDARRHPLQGRRRHPVLRPPRGQGRVWPI